MIGSDRIAKSSDTSILSPEARPEPVADDGLPLRCLLIRTKSGPLPWLAQAMAQLMAPVDIVQVVGMANALWRLGHERFDAVLLDVDLADRRVIRRCREQILDIAVVPVLDLAEPPALEQASARNRRSVRRRRPPRSTDGRPCACPGSGARSASRTRLRPKSPPSAETGLPVGEAPLSSALTARAGAATNP